jgi:hypothetical protein
VLIEGTNTLSMQLALGTLKLEGTGAAVTPEQAAELLPLWKAANKLSEADNVTPQELEGLFKQIQKAMTPEQMQAIQSMDLSGSNMREIAQELGLELPAGGPGEITEEQRATMEAARESGQMPALAAGRLRAFPVERVAFRAEGFKVPQGIATRPPARVGAVASGALSIRL